MRASDLNPNPANPRKISDQKLSMLEKSLREFGDLSGVVYNRRSEKLVGGHQRVRALPENSVVTILKRYEPATRSGTVAEGFIELDGERYQYREVNWDETRERAANIAANQHGGEWDIPLLNDWLLDLDAKNFDMDLTGFDRDEIETLMAPLPRDKEEDSEDEAERRAKEVECPKCGERFTHA